MNEFVVILTIVTFMVIVVLSGRYFYLIEIKQSTKRIISKLNIDIFNLNYSFEQMVYFYSLPSNIPVLKDAKRTDIFIKYDYASLLFQQLNGIKVYVKTGSDKVLLAYLNTKDFRLPSLDVLMEEGKINESTYRKLSISMLIHKKTMDEITDEVYKQMQVGRYQRAKEPIG